MHRYNQGKLDGVSNKGKGKRAAPEGETGGDAAMKTEEDAAVKEEATDAAGEFWEKLTATPAPAPDAAAAVEVKPEAKEDEVDFKDEMAADAFLKQLEAVMKDKVGCCKLYPPPPPPPPPSFSSFTSFSSFSSSPSSSSSSSSSSLAPG